MKKTIWKKKKIEFITLFALVFILLLGNSSCQSYKNIPYLQNSEYLLPDSITRPLYDARIQPKDILTISVHTTNPEASLPFNLTVANIQQQGRANALTTQSALLPYLVDNNGEIDFPVVGKIKMGGLTKNEAEHTIKKALRSYLTEEPIVTIRMENYKITVLGEVARPNTFTIANEKVNIFEALAMAGDLTVYGIRENVKLIRENEMGQQDIVTLNLNDASIVRSPYYYLQQNDILYITPNKVKAKDSDIGRTTSTWISATSILISIASLIVNIVR